MDQATLQKMAESDFAGAYPRTEEVLHEIAASVACRLVLPAEDELQLDLDGADAYVRSVQLREMIERNDLLVIIGTEEWTSKSGQGCHVVLKLGYILSAAERVTWQALLGSDPKREVLNMGRVIRGEPCPIALFRPWTEPASVWEAMTTEGDLL